MSSRHAACWASDVYKPVSIPDVVSGPSGNTQIDVSFPYFFKRSKARHNRFTVA